MATVEYVFCFYTISIFLVVSAQFDVEFSTRLDGYVFKTKHQASLKSCWHECSVRSKCLSFNYFRRVHKCELNADRISDLSGIPTEGTGYVYWERKTVQATVQCGVNVCCEHEMCDVETNNCLTKECPAILTPNADVVQGNMNDVGSKAVLQCAIDNNHTPIFVRTECQATGMWSNTPASCPPECDNDWNVYRSSCYKITANQLGWQDGQDYCQSVGANLVKVDDEFEQQFIAALATEHGHTRYWIGLRFYTFVNEFRWSDMSELEFSAWGPDQPDQYECAELMETYDWGWNDSIDKTNARFCICEKAAHNP